MFDIAWSEIAVIAVVALLVIGPKDLPKALYTAGKWVRSARKVAGEFQRHVDDMMREAELDDLKKNVQQVRDFNLKSQIEKTIDPHGELKDAFDPTAGSGAPMKPGWTKPGWTKPGLEAPADKPAAPSPAAPAAGSPPGHAPVPSHATPAARPEVMTPPVATTPAPVSGGVPAASPPDAPARGGESRAGRPLAGLQGQGPEHGQGGPDKTVRE